MPSRRGERVPKALGPRGRTAPSHWAALGAFVVLCMVCAVVIGITLVRAVGRGDETSGTAAIAEGDEATHVAPGSLLFRNTTQERTFGRLAVAGVGADAARRIATLRCSRVSFAGGRGLCLTVKRNVISNYSALVFNDRFEIERTFQLAGIPSRTRMSPSGRVGATTVFVLGHSYADSGFSTRTSIIDMESGELLEDMEQFTVLKDSEKFSAVDFNFWGVSFIDDNQFYATLGTGGKTYLIRGEVDSRSARVVRSGVECPSLSPDGRRIAFKKRVNSGIGPVRWRLSVLDLESGRERELAETRSVDDQVTWLDDDRILYTLTEGGQPTPSTDDGQSTFSTDVWIVGTDGGGSPRIHLRGASSPTVVVQVR
jgi:hypothetical protein